MTGKRALRKVLPPTQQASEGTDDSHSSSVLSSATGGQLWDGLRGLATVKGQVSTVINPKWAEGTRNVPKGLGQTGNRWQGQAAISIACPCSAGVLGPYEF